MPHFANFLMFIEIHQVDGKLHEEGVDRFAGADPQPFARFQALVFEQAGPPFRAGVRYIGGRGQDGIASLVGNAGGQVKNDRGGAWPRPT